MGQGNIHNPEFTRLNDAIEALRDDPMAFSIWTLNANDVFELFAKNNGKAAYAALEKVIDEVDAQDNE